LVQPVNNGLASASRDNVAAIAVVRRDIGLEFCFHQCKKDSESGSNPVLPCHQAGISSTTTIQNVDTGERFTFRSRPSLTPLKAAVFGYNLASCSMTSSISSTFTHRATALICPNTEV